MTKDGLGCVCLLGKDGAACALDSDCGGAGTCDQDTCQCVGAGGDAGTSDDLFLCLEDTSTSDTDPNGAEVDAIQDYTGDLDAYAVASTCNFGANADPMRSDCSALVGPKTFCSGDTGYVTLGGPGGWACGELAMPVENGDIVSPVGCTPGTPPPVTVSICKEADPSSPSCVPCPLTLSGGSSCQVSGL